MTDQQQPAEPSIPELVQRVIEEAASIAEWYRRPDDAKCDIGPIISCSNALRNRLAREAVRSWQAKVMP